MSQNLSILRTKMEPSCILMSRQRTRDRMKALADLNKNLSKLIISISYDGGLMFDSVITCGISGTDSTQHKILSLEINIEDECPIAPHSLTILEVAEHARSYMKSRGVDLPAEKYDLWVVSPLQKNCAGENAKNPKYRGIVKKPTITDAFTPGVSASDPGSARRIPHLFFAKVTETKAPMENKAGSSAAVNTSKIHKGVMSLKRYLREAYLGKSKELPDYAALFVYSNVEALDNFVDYVGDLAVKDPTLLSRVSGNTSACNIVVKQFPNHLILLR